MNHPNVVGGWLQDAQTCRTDELGHIVKLMDFTKHQKSRIVIIWKILECQNWPLHSSTLSLGRSETVCLLVAAICPNQFKQKILAILNNLRTIFKPNGVPRAWALAKSSRTSFTTRYSSFDLVFVSGSDPFHRIVGHGPWPLPMADGKHVMKRVGLVQI